MAWTLIAIGKLRSGPLHALQTDLMKRFVPPLRLIELEARAARESERSADEAALILKAIPGQAQVLAMDERGRSLSSREMAQQLASFQRPAVFVIGGAQGLHDSVRARADDLWSLGRMTWPHLWARVLLIEQLYRSQQIHRGHPYHKE